MLAENSSSLKARAERTSRDDEVTPPLLAEASLKTITPFFSRKRRAGCVKNRLAPSTMYLKRGLPVSSRSLLTLLVLTASGRPPQGTNSWAEAYASRWNWLRKSMQRSTRVPSGRVALGWSTRTRKPLGPSLDTSNSLTMRRELARRVISSRWMPSGSHRTPDPSTMAIVLSLEILISFEPRSPSGPPVWNLFRSSSCK